MDNTLLGGWPSLRLDCVRLRPVTKTGSFSFLDPVDILRQSHLIAAFSHGKFYMDGVGISDLSRDGADDVMYYVNRFVDRDMAMRYLLGLGVGHTYAHSTIVNSPSDTSSNVDLEQDGVGEDEGNSRTHGVGDDVESEGEVEVEVEEGEEDEKDDEEEDFDDGDDYIAHESDDTDDDSINESEDSGEY